jgi:hypothetical protein
VTRSGGTVSGPMPWSDGVASEAGSVTGASRRRPSRGVAGHAAACALLLAAITGFFWKLTLTTQFDWIQGLDLCEMVLPWLDVQAREWHAHGFASWDPYLWLGQPLLGQMQPGAAYPPNWILFLWPLENGHVSTTALQWHFVLIRFMAAAFAYAFCRSLGRSFAASIAGGLVFALAGYVGTAGHPQMASSAVWIPLVFLFLLRAADARGLATWADGALCGLFLGIAFLSGHHQVPIFTSLAFAATWLYFVLRGPRRLRLSGAAALALLVAALTAAFQVLPGIEYGRLAVRWVTPGEPLGWSERVPYAVHSVYGLRAHALLGLVLPRADDYESFVGVVALALAGLAVAVGWSETRVRVLAALSVGALVYALGQYSVFQGFLYAFVPYLEKARIPSAAIVLLQFGVAALAAHGMDRLGPDDGSTPWPRRVTRVVLGFGVVTLAACALVLLANHMEFPADGRVVVTALVALLLAALLAAWRRGPLSPPHARVLLVLLLLFELGLVSSQGFADRADPAHAALLDRVRGNADVAAFLHRQPGPFRAETAGEGLVGNWGAWHGIEMHEGYTASATANVVRSGLLGPAGRLLSGVAYTLSYGPPPAEAGAAVFTGASGLTVYRLDGAFPRAWAVHRLRRVPDRQAAAAIIRGRVQDLREEALMEGAPPALETCPGSDTVEWVEREAARLALRVVLPCTGMVVVSDTFYPGWRADVDGHEAPIHEVDGALRGVVVPAGGHVLTMRYRPASVFLGASLSLTGILGALVLAALARGGRGV